MHANCRTSLTGRKAIDTIHTSRDFCTSNSEVSGVDYSRDMTVKSGSYIIIGYNVWFNSKQPNPGKAKLLEQLPLSVIQSRGGEPFLAKILKIKFSKLKPCYYIINKIKTQMNVVQRT